MKRATQGVFSSVRLGVAQASSSMKRLCQSRCCRYRCCCRRRARWGVAFRYEFSARCTCLTDGCLIVGPFPASAAWPNDRRSRLRFRPAQRYQDAAAVSRHTVAMNHPRAAFEPQSKSSILFHPFAFSSRVQAPKDHFWRNAGQICAGHIPLFGRATQQ